MSENEREFASLVKNYRDAEAELRRLNSNFYPMQAYETPRGVITPDSIATYKVALEQNQEKQATIDQAQSSLTDATNALESYFPASVKAKVDRGIAIVSAVPEGFVAMLKQHGKYLLFHGQTEAAAIQNMQSRPPR